MNEDIIKYPSSDRNLPRNVRLAIRLAGKTGFLSKKVWNEQFNKGSLSWKKKQFSKLLVKKILVDYIKIGRSEFFKLGKAGTDLSRKLGVKPTTPPLNNQILHDEKVTEIILALENCGLSHEWLCESELKENASFPNEVLPTSSKIPDAVLKMNINDSFRNVAFEYERTLKSSWRIKEVLRAYGRALHFPLVVIICEDDVIKKSYLKILKSLSDTNLNKRIGISIINGWQTSPHEQPIQMIERTFKLKDIVKI